MNDERVERLRDYLYRNNSGRIEAGRLMDLAKSCLRAYDKLAEENERLRKERDEAEQRGRREERFRFWRAVLDGGIEITDSGQYRADIESSVHHALEQAKQRGAQRERERIARLFDDLYPEWAAVIRNGTVSKDELFSRIDEQNAITLERRRNQAIAANFADKLKSDHPHRRRWR